MSTVVVGVDGSRESRAALRFALEEARLRGARLRVVHAWLVPIALTGGAPPHILPQVLEELKVDGERLLAEAIAEALEGAEPPVEIEQRVVEGPAAAVLLRAAEDADLLVVGSRGRGGFTGLLLGSVSQQCAHHAPCPIVIVRAGD
jgi:nucleotide-binding universal stress UspA family protein